MTDYRIHVPDLHTGQLAVAQSPARFRVLCAGRRWGKDVLELAEQVRDAFDLMMLRIQKRAPNAHLRGGFVEKMGTRGREVILGMTRDSQFGPMLMFGLGGIFVEVMKDVTFHLAPITADEAMQMLKGTRSYALLKGARGQAPVDLDAIAGALQRISQLAHGLP